MKHIIIDQDPIEMNLQAYNRIAAQFAIKNANMDEDLIERTARLMAYIQPGERILDLGCGAGRDLAWFEANGAQVIGADLSNRMLLEARRVSKSDLCQMEMRCLGFADGSFAGIWYDAALLHLPKKEVTKALSEIARVLTSGGHFFLSVQKGHGEGVESGWIGNVQRFFARYNAPEMARLLEQAGFSITRQDEYEFRRTWLWFETVRTT